MTLNQPLFESVCASARKAALFHSAADALEWDERTGMPVAGGDYRADQVSQLRASAHEIRTASAYGDALGTLNDQVENLNSNDDVAATISGLHHDFVRDSKLPLELVSKISAATVRGQQVWDQARKDDSYSAFSSVLQNIVSLKIEAGERMAEGTDRSVYEALLDEYEPGAKTSLIEPVFADLKKRLAALIAEISEAPRKPDLQILKRSCPLNAQRNFSKQVAGWIGFDFARGRLDETSHPFCTTLGPNDCRILSRYDEHWLPGGLYGTLHEAGHGMYEQGLRGDWFGLPPGSYVSLGIHESQSRLWENQVGRSKAFLGWLHPRAIESFPEALGTSTVDDFYFAANSVEPSLIRVEADEATYNLHILIRFELEQALIGGDLAIDDLPEAWNEQYRTALGISPPSDADGVLQDVHWSAGLFGYFPTYTIGNLIAAQLFDSATEQIDDLDGKIASGDFQPLLHWLRSNIHQHGRCYTGDQLVENATGHALSSDHLMSYLENKLRPLYGI